MTNTGTIKVTKGTLDIKGAVTRAGVDTIVGASMLEFDGAVASGQSIYFNGNGGTLDLGAPQSFAGTIKGFDLGTTGDAINVLSGWTFTGATDGATVAEDRGRLAGGEPSRENRNHPAVRRRRILAGTVDVEVPLAAYRNAIGRSIAWDDFGGKLGGGVRRGGLIDGGAGREHHAMATGESCGFRHPMGRQNVRSKILIGLLDAERNADQPRQMNDGRGWMSGGDLHQRSLLGHVGLM